MVQYNHTTPHFKDKSLQFLVQFHSINQLTIPKNPRKCFEQNVIQLVYQKTSVI